MSSSKLLRFDLEGLGFEVQHQMPHALCAACTSPSHALRQLVGEEFLRQPQKFVSKKEKDLRDMSILLRDLQT